MLSFFFGKPEPATPDDAAKLIDIIQKTQPYHVMNEIRKLVTKPNILNLSVDVPSREWWGVTPMMIGALYKHEILIVEFLKIGGDVHKTDSMGRTPLIYAIDKNRFNNIKINIAVDLINAGSDVNHVTKEGKTPILYATEKNMDELIEILLDAGANINDQTYNKITPLLLASKENLIKSANFLIEHGADVNAADENGMTPLMYAVKNTSTSLIEELLDAGANVNVVDKEGNTAIWFTTPFAGSEKIIKLLADHDANLNILKDPGLGNKMTYLMYKLRRSEYDIAKILILNGADVNIPDQEGKTPLQYLEEKKQMETRRGRGRQVYDVVDELIELIKNPPKVKREKVVSKPWEGFTRSDISKLDTIFEDNAINYACCPVCLEYVERSEACMYMKHDCRASGKYYHEKLYKKYKNPEGFIGWCTICGRIALGHAHYQLGLADGLKPELITQTGRDPFEKDCRGPNGGGGIPEKLARFRQLRQTAKELQASVGKMSHKDAMNKLVEDTWNAPLAERPNLKKIAKNKKWNIPLENFPANTVKSNTAGPIKNVVRPNTNKNLVPVVTETGTNFMGDTGPLIQFRHRQPDGTVNDHTGMLITATSLQDFIEGAVKSFGTEEFGHCYMYPGQCKARLYPEEVKPYISDELYNEYKEKFNRKFQGATGGRRLYRGGQQENIFVEASNAICNTPGSAFSTTRKNRKNNRKGRTLSRRR
jgi:ankyrin repeat protein